MILPENHNVFVTVVDMNKIMEFHCVSYKKQYTQQCQFSRYIEEIKYSNAWGSKGSPTAWIYAQSFKRTTGQKLFKSDVI